MNNSELRSKTNSSNDVVIKAEDVSKSFAETSVGAGKVQVLSSCNLELHQGELLAVVGSSGSGKSTLMHLLGGLDRPDSGKVLIEEQNLADLNESQLAALRNQKLGFVYQFHHLLPEFSALENVAMPLILRRLPHHDALRRAAAVLSRVGLAHREKPPPKCLI
jgi:lipoprotein-releasing system ATP-binding protein